MHRDIWVAFRLRLMRWGSLTEGLMADRAACSVGQRNRQAFACGFATRLVERAFLQPLCRWPRRPARFALAAHQGGQSVVPSVRRVELLLAKRSSEFHCQLHVVVHLAPLDVVTLKPMPHPNAMAWHGSLLGTSTTTTTTTTTPVLLLLTSHLPRTVVPHDRQAAPVSRGIDRLRVRRTCTVYPPAQVHARARAPLGCFVSSWP
jgi:hypothetical protein